MLEKMFRIKEHGSTVGVEMAAGVTTFLTMAYILIVNPSILVDAGMPRDVLFSATAIGAIIATLLMAFYANMPFALAPGMGLNAFFAYIVVIGKGYSWQEALTAVLVSGVLFLVLSILGIREALVKGFPEALKYAVGVSLGLMIAGIGMKNADLIVHSGVFLKLGDYKEGAPLLALIGLAVTGILMALRVKAAILVGIVISTILGMFMHDAEGKTLTTYQSLSSTGVFVPPPWVGPVAFAFSFDAARLLTLDFLVVIFTFLFVDIFDSLGTFLGVLTRVGVDAGRYDKRISRALMCDAIGTMAGACFGTSTVTTYVESSAGVSAGGRTGLTALVVGVLFIAAMFFSPLFLMVPKAATAPAMIVVGMFLSAVAVKINFEDFTEGIPAILSIMVTTLTWSISDGLMFGWVGLVILKLCTGKIRELNGIAIVVGVIFLLKIVFL